MTTIYSPYGGEVTSTPIPQNPQPQRPRRDVQPGPGQVLIGRKKVETYIGSIEKPIDVIEAEERGNIFATVLRVGSARRFASGEWEESWVSEGEEVIIAPNLCTEVELGGDSVWLIPFSGIRAKFAERKQEAAE